MSEIDAVATQFVDLVLRHERWGGITELPDDEVQVLLATVSAAGFEPKAVVPGKVKGKGEFQVIGWKNTMSW